MKQKILFLPMLIFAAYGSGFSQPTIKSQRVAGGTSSDNLTSTYLTKDGGFIAGGYSSSGISGTKTEANEGGDDYWIVKYDHLGNIQWDKTLGGSGTDYLESLEQTSDGGYILGGESSSNKSGQKSENSRGDQDYWIVKLNKNGKVQWDKTIGGSSTEWLRQVSQTTDGGYILGGYSYSDISGEKTSNSRGAGDYWIVKLDGSGNIQWDKTMGGNANEFLQATLQTKDGGYMVGGYSYSSMSGEKTSNNYGNTVTDYWILKLDTAGNIQWDKTIGGNGYDFLQDIKQTSDNGYILAGWSDSDNFGNKSEGSRGGDDYWVVKTDAQGNEQWDKTIGGNAQDVLTHIEITKDSGYICGGYSFSGIAGEKSEVNRGARDYWVVKLNKSGIVQFDKTVGGKGDDYLYSVKEAETNKYLLAGYSASPISGDKKQNSIGGTDFWLVGLVNKTAPFNNAIALNNVEVKQLNNATLKSFLIYPNPAKDILHIQTTGKATVTLTDQQGKTILTKTINGNGEINVSHLPAGLYYLKNGETGVVQKVVLTK